MGGNMPVSEEMRYQAERRKTLVQTQQGSIQSNIMLTHSLRQQMFLNLLQLQEVAESAIRLDTVSIEGTNRDDFNTIRGAVGSVPMVGQVMQSGVSMLATNVADDHTLRAGETESAARLATLTLMNTIDQKQYDIMHRIELTNILLTDTMHNYYNLSSPTEEQTTKFLEDCQYHQARSQQSSEELLQFNQSLQQFNAECAKALEDNAQIRKQAYAQHESPSKYITQQHPITRYLYQCGVMTHLQSKLNASNPAVHDRWTHAEHKMLDKAFPKDFVMRRSFVGEKVKASRERKRAESLIKITSEGRFEKENPDLKPQETIERHQRLKTDHTVKLSTWYAKDEEIRAIKERLDQLEHSLDPKTFVDQLLHTNERVMQVSAPKPVNLTTDQAVLTLPNSTSLIVGAKPYDESDLGDGVTIDLGDEEIDLGDDDDIILDPEDEMPPDPMTKAEIDLSDEKEMSKQGKTPSAATTVTGQMRGVIEEMRQKEHLDNQETPPLSRTLLKK